VMTPKSLLRHPLVRSNLNEFTSGRFRDVIDDPNANPDRVRRVVICSGKVYYDFYFDPNERDPIRANRLIPPQVAIVRVEQLHPFPEEQLLQIQRRYRKANEWVWAQEEPQNMGAWSYIEPRLRTIGMPVEFVGRDASASPATGSYRIHVREQRELIDVALTGGIPHVVRATKPQSKETRPTDSSSSVVAGS
jgi:2-oxoglutarate dehydrogenase E1 component